jgi:CBS domain-containing protein
VLIKDIMISRNLLAARETDRLASAGQKMVWGRLRHLPVLRGEDVVGVISERDILARQGRPEGRGWEDEVVGAVMSRPPLVAVPEEQVAQAAARMAANKIGCLPVVEHGRLVGIVTTTDLMGAAVSDLFRSTPRLSGPVGEAMRAEVFSVREDESVMEAVDIMVARRIRHVPVVDRQGRVVGMVSDRDVRTALGDPAEAADSWPPAATGLLVRGLMSRDPVVVQADAPLSVAATFLLNRRVGALPVVDREGRLRGILSYLDLIRALRT